MSKAKEKELADLAELFDGFAALLPHRESLSVALEAEAEVVVGEGVEAALDRARTLRTLERDRRSDPQMTGQRRALILTTAARLDRAAREKRRSG